MHNMLCKIHISNRGDLDVVVQGFKIGVIDRKCMTYLEYRNGKFLMKEVGEHVFDRSLFRSATKEDIRRAGIWELVINKNELPKRELCKTDFCLIQKYAY